MFYDRVTITLSQWFENATRNTSARHPTDKRENFYSALLIQIFTCERISQPVPEEEGDGHGLPHLVGAGPGAGGEGSPELVQHPCLGGDQALQMFLGTANHGERLRR